MFVSADDDADAFVTPCLVVVVDVVFAAIAAESRIEGLRSISMSLR